MSTALCVSPHPDDEVLGAPGALLGLAAQGWDVVNLAVGLGRPEQVERRREEVAEATRRAGFGNIAADPPIDVSADADRVPAIADVQRFVARQVADRAPTLLVAPSPHDGHHGHEIVGAAAWEVARSSGCRLWLWGLWADLPAPSLLVPVPADRLAVALHALAAHAGEVARNDYERLLRSRAELNAVVGPERVFGFGSPGRDDRYCELLMEVEFDGDAALLGAPRTFADDELAAFVPDRRVDWLGTEASPRRRAHERLDPPHG